MLTDGLIVIDAEGRIEQVNPPRPEILHGTVADA
jgi:PAS domain-containing protein